MATPEPTPSPKDLLLPVSVEEFFKWDDLEEIHLSNLEDSSSDEGTTGRKTSNTVTGQMVTKLYRENVRKLPSYQVTRYQ